MVIIWENDITVCHSKRNFKDKKSMTSWLPLGVDTNNVLLKYFEWIPLWTLSKQTEHGREKQVCIIWSEQINALNGFLAITNIGNGGIYISILHMLNVYKSKGNR
jgi:hypothetical protein